MKPIFPRTLFRTQLHILQLPHLLEITQQIVQLMQMEIYSLIGPLQMFLVLFLHLIIYMLLILHFDSGVKETINDSLSSQPTTPA